MPTSEKTRLPIPITHSISAKLLKVVFTIYLAVVVLVTLLHLAAEYVETKNTVMQELKILQRAFGRGVATAVWYLDISLLESEMQGMLEDPVVVGVAIENDKGESFLLGKTPHHQNTNHENVTRHRTSDIDVTGKSSNLIEHSFPLLYIAKDGERYTVGTASLYSGHAVIMHKLRLKFLLILLATIINMGAFWVIVLLVGQHLLSRPLAMMAEHARKLDLDTLEQGQMHLGITDRNELTVLEEAFNAMVQKLLDARTQLYDYANELNQSQQQLQDILDNTTAVIFMKDTEGRYLLINRQYESLFHIRKSEILGKTDYDIFPKEMADAFRRNDQQVIEANAPLELEEYVPHDDGIHTYLSMKFPLHDSSGTIYAICGIATDISERKTAEKLLKNFSQTLQQEVGQRTQELKIAKEQALEAKEAAETANRAKSTFLANMSHELRTPLNAVLGYAQILSRSQHLSPDEKEFLSIIMRSGENLLALINDVLELSKIEANRIELQPVSFDLHQMLSDLEAMFRLRTDRKRLTFTFEYASDVPPYIRADQNKLRQVLINLLGNAVKYTEEGEVTLEVTKVTKVTKVEEESGQSKICNLKFKISDTGIGIASADVKHIFDAFVRVGEQQYNTGTGLGLPISQKYVHMMGGNIHVESEVGTGSTFSFEIPVELADQSILDTQQSSIPKQVIGLEPGQPSYRLLIVEDNEDGCNLMVQMLQPMGFQVREALNGEEAIALWNTWHPHLIWMDMRMPVLDGYEATRRIRKEEQKLRRAEERKLDTGYSILDTGIKQSTSSIRHPATSNQHPASSIQHPVIIALTASAFEEDRERVLNAGCDDFVRKPFRQMEIFEMLHKHLGIRFVYEEGRNSKLETRNSKLEEVLTPAALAGLPAEVLVDLKQGAEEVDIDLLFSVVEQIRERDVLLADALTRLVEDFEYDEILRLIREAGKGVME